MRTENINIVNTAFSYLHDNFIILNEYSITDYNNKVFSLFQKYNKNAFKVSFIDCSEVNIVNHYNIDYIVSLNEDFKLFEGINLLNLD